ncbi:MAG: hypothetical protein QXG03_03285 [Halalkalicoccus sp.]
MAAFAGRWVAALGAVVVASGFVPQPYWDEWFGLLSTVVVLLASAGIVLGARRY